MPAMTVTGSRQTKTEQGNGKERKTASASDSATTLALLVKHLPVGATALLLLPPMWTLWTLVPQLQVFLLSVQIIYVSELSRRTLRIFSDFTWSDNPPLEIVISETILYILLRSLVTFRHSSHFTLYFWFHTFFASALTFTFRPFLSLELLHFLFACRFRAIFVMIMS